MQGMGPDTVARDALYLTTHSNTKMILITNKCTSQECFCYFSNRSDLSPYTNMRHTWKAITSYKLDRSVCKYITNTQ